MIVTFRTDAVPFSCSDRNKQPGYSHITTSAALAVQQITAEAVQGM
jgi:hypothetical protein